jgi:uncharacterized protein (TIGR02588 family)
MSAGRASRYGMWRKRTSFEWALLAVSLIASAAVVVGLGVSGLTGPDGPADVRVTVADAGAAADLGRALEVTVQNVGGTSAANVVVEITMDDVTRELMLDLVAKGDTELATVVVPGSASGEPRAKVVSYTSP